MEQNEICSQLVTLNGLLEEKGHTQCNTVVVKSGQKTHRKCHLCSVTSK